MAVLKQVGHKGKRVKVWTGMRYYPLGASIWPALTPQEIVTVATHLKALFGATISPDFLEDHSARAIFKVETHYVKEPEPEER
jgi:hypothetical protein